MTNQTVLVSLTKRALAKQLMRAGSPKKEAEAVVARLSYWQMRRKLPLHVVAGIAWKAATTPRSQR